jgi:hypothetical protein
MRVQRRGPKKEEILFGVTIVAKQQGRTQTTGGDLRSKPKIEHIKKKAMN